jgi:hypothetical protein
MANSTAANPLVFFNRAAARARGVIVINVLSRWVLSWRKTTVGALTINFTR